MRAWLALVRFEVERNWPVLVAGLLGGVAALGAPAVYRAGGGTPADVAGAAALAVAGTLAALGSLALGARSLAGGLVAGHDELVLSWPVGAGTVWLARMVAAAGLALASALLALTPAALAHPTVAQGWWPAAQKVVPFAIVWSVALAAAGGVVRALVAARSPWIAGALAAGVVLWATFTGVWVRVVLALIGDVTAAGLRFPVVLSTLAAVVPPVAASAAAALAGRAQLRRWAHVAGAVATAGLLAGAGGLRLWAGAAMSPRPQDLEILWEARGVPDAGLALVGGSVRRAGLRAFAWFAVEPEAGRWDLLGLGAPTGDPVVVAPSGRFVVSSLITPAWRVGRLAVLELTARGPRRVAQVETHGIPLALSGDGRLLLVHFEGLERRKARLEVLRVRDGSLDRKLAPPGSGYFNAWVSDGGAVRLLLSELKGGPTTRVVTSPPGGAEWTEVWRAPGFRVGFSDSGREVLLRLEPRDDGTPVSVRRLEDGAELWGCKTATGEGRWEVRLVDAGRLVEARTSAERPAELVLHTPEGIAWTARLPFAASDVRFGGRPRPDVLLLTVHRPRAAEESFALDLRDGSLRPLGHGVRVLRTWRVGTVAPPALAVRNRCELLRVTPDLRLEPVPVR